MTPAEQRHLAGIRAGLSRVARYDDESIVNDKWVRQRYDCGCVPSFAPARKAAVRAAWHEAGHAVAALELGARFSSASIHHGGRTEGRVHGIRGAATTSCAPGCRRGRATAGTRGTSAGPLARVSAATSCAHGATAR